MRNWWDTCYLCLELIYYRFEWQTSKFLGIMISKVDNCSYLLTLICLKSLSVVISFQLPPFFDLLCVRPYIIISNFDPNLCSSISFLITCFRICSRKNCINANFIFLILRYLFSFI